MLSPKKIAIYYGFPSLVNGVTTIPDAINVFKNYDLVIFVSGLENATHADHLNTMNIIAGLPITTKVFGTIDSSKSNPVMWAAVDNWFNMGVHGIFCDRFGYDYINRFRQNVIVEYIHSKNMIAFVKAANINDVLSNAKTPPKNPTGAVHMLLPTDWYFKEGFQISNGSYQSAATWKSNSDLMLSYITNIQIACATTYDTTAFNQNKFNYAYMSCVLYGFHAFGWGEFLYSASSNFLPLRTRPTVLGDHFITNITEPIPGTYQRNTNIGVRVNTTNHTTSLTT